MSYQSIDAIQNILADTYFFRTNDPKKASGRALGVFVELITYYLLKDWQFQNSLAIETRLPEYGYSNLTHNVEFTLHRCINKNINIPLGDVSSLSSNKIININRLNTLSGFEKSSSKNIFYSSPFWIIKNGAVIGTTSNKLIVAYVDTANDTYKYVILNKCPFAMFECKRVGKEGNFKGPQTIEKAKQGAYVAKTVSALQKIVRQDGTTMGVYFDESQKPHIENYEILLKKIITGEIENIKNFILTVGIVSNHGNWFTNSNKNKELDVLGNSYDWLLFLTDCGLASFVEDILNIPECKNAFSYSYSVNPSTSHKNQNIFTKSCISFEADRAITEYFSKNRRKINSWFTVINQNGKTINDLKKQLKALNR